MATVVVEDGRVSYRRERSRLIDASPCDVWPWLVQMGFDRVPAAAVDALEKAFGVGRFATGWSDRRVEPTLQDLTVGGRMSGSMVRISTGFRARDSEKASQ